MWLDIHTSGMSLDSSIRQRLDRRLSIALVKFAHRIDRVHVYLMDENGPRGGIDKRCRVVIGVRGVGTVIVEEQSDMLERLIDALSDRVGYAVSKRVERSNFRGRSHQDHPLSRLNPERN
jgi:putative sigma-54 modulation protein